MKQRFNLVLLCTYLMCICYSCQGQAVAALEEVTIDTLVKNTRDTLLITAVGDMMLGSAFPSKLNLPKDDAVSSFKAVSPYLKGDIVFGNLEGVFLNNGTSEKCKGIDSNSCYAFRMPDRYASIYKKAGFNLLSIANNHAGDFENRGRRNTTRLLDSLEINYAGQLNKPFAIFEKDSVKYGFIAFAPNENTVPFSNLDSVRARVSDLKKQVDIVIISFHGGAEGARYEHVTRHTEIFYKENRGDVYAIAHAAVDAGADVVLGHGPHVTRAVEVYKNKFIAYSLGNFCTYGMFNLSGPNGFAPLLQLKLSKQGDFLKADVVSTKQTKLKGLQIDTLNTAYKKIKILTDIDFKGHQLLFENNQISIMK